MTFSQLRNELAEGKSKTKERAKAAQAKAVLAAFRSGQLTWD